MGTGVLVAVKVGAWVCVALGIGLVMVVGGFWLGIKVTVASISGSTAAEEVADGTATGVEVGAVAAKVAKPVSAGVLVNGVSSGGATINRANPMQ